MYKVSPQFWVRFNFFFFIFDQRVRFNYIGYGKHEPNIYNHAKFGPYDVPGFGLPQEQYEQRLSLAVIYECLTKKKKIKPIIFSKESN